MSCCGETDWVRLAGAHGWGHGGSYDVGSREIVVRLCEDGGMNRTGAAPSLPMGRKGSRFAFMKIGVSLWCDDEIVMFGTCFWE